MRSHNRERDVNSSVRNLLATRRLRIAGAIISATVVAGFDFLTGEDIAFSFFYVLPVLLLTWETGRRPGIAFAVLCAGANAGTDILAGASARPGTTFWNFLVRAATLTTTSLLADRLHTALEHEKHLTRADPLTGVCSLRWFRERAEMELDRARRTRGPVSLAFMDLDDLKVVNDDFGHAKGDDFLAAVGRILNESTRSIDVVGRLGGDEFAILMPETDGAAAKVVVDRIRQLVKAYQADAELGEIGSVSVGLVTTDSPPESLDALILMADQLMYGAKRVGKNQVKVKDLATGAPEPVDHR